MSRLRLPLQCRRPPLDLLGRSGAAAPGPVDPTIPPPVTSGTLVVHIDPAATANGLNFQDIAGTIPVVDDLDPWGNASNLVTGILQEWTAANEGAARGTWRDGVASPAGFTGSYFLGDSFQDLRSVVASVTPQNGTLFVVADGAYNPTNAWLFTLNNAAWGMGYRSGDGGFYALIDGAVAISGAGPTNGGHVCCLDYQSGGVELCEFWIDGVSLGTATPAGNLNFNNTNVYPGRNSTTAQFAGPVGPALLYNEGPLSTADKNSHGNWLAGRAGLTWTDIV